MWTRRARVSIRLPPVLALVLALLALVPFAQAAAESGSGPEVVELATEGELFEAQASQTPAIQVADTTGSDVVASSTVDLGPAPWWVGDCDVGHLPGSFPRGGSYLGVDVCGVNGPSPDVRWTRPGWGHLEWQCPELAMRLMAQAYGVRSYAANGNTVVANYDPAYGGGLEKVTNGTVGRAPRPGDVISFDHSSFGHVLVVAESHVDGNGNGTLLTMSQNDTGNGWRTLAVASWQVQPFGPYVATGWLHDPQGRGEGTAPVDPQPVDPPLPSAPVPVAGRIHPVTPVRVLDSRTGLGTTPWAWAPWERRDVRLAGVAGVPPSATAVVLNVTAVGGTQPSYLTVYPGGSERPTASNLNWPAGDTRPNLVTAQLGDYGSVTIYNDNGSVHVVADLVGWIDDGMTPGASTLIGLSPTRILDSRVGTGLARPWGPSTERGLVVRGATTPVPADATAVLLNVTVVGGTAASYLTLWPAGAPRPSASNLNWGPGATRPNLVLVPVGVADSVSIFNLDGAVDVVADVVGYLAPGDAGALVAARAPVRVLDSRSGVGDISGPWGPGTERVLRVAGVGDVPAGVRSVALNVTATQATAATFVTVWPADRPRPLASNLNVAPGATVPNLVVVPVAPDGTVRLANDQGSVHLVADVVAYAP